MNVVVRAVAAAAVGFASCATVPSVADRRFAAGDYQGAAAAYEEALRTDRRAHLDAGLCLRLGIAYAVPGTSAHDPSRAAAVLRDVATRFPKRAEGAQAALLVPQLDYEARLSADLAVATTRVGALEAEIARVREDYRGLGAAAKTTAEQLARARAQLAEKDVQLRRVRDELERLKSIDLRRSP
jgi:hypothetical protein